MLLIFVVFVFSSCQDDPIPSVITPAVVEGFDVALIDSTLGFTVKVKDSTLYFLEAKDLLVALTTLKEMPVEKRRNWEKSIGFVSSQTLIENLHNKIETIDNEDDYRELINANGELIKESADELHGVKSRIYGFYPYIASTKGFFVSETCWGKVFDGNLYSCNYFDYEGYDIMSGLSSNNDVSDTNVKLIKLDFNEDDNLKSYHVIENQSSTKITIAMKDYSTNNPTKTARFNMEIVNSYAMSSVSTYGGTKHYFLISYFGNCCEPDAYTYYYAALGGTQHFTRYGSQWRIQVPYEGYLDNYNWSAGAPDWDESMDDYNHEVTPAYYNYLGKAELNCSIKAIKRNKWQNWVAYSGSVIYYSNVSAQVQIGRDVSGHSTLHTESVSIGKVNVNKIEQANWDSGKPICTYSLSEYTSNPPVEFKGCVSGDIYARLCPSSTCSFSYTY